MTTADEPTADALGVADGVPRERMWERIRTVDRDWSPKRGRAAIGPYRVLASVTVVRASAERGD